ncbi:MAG: hypothetical protein WC717_04165 [Candidatus Micrarchaeia archaeon]
MQDLSTRQSVKTQSDWRTDKRNRWANPHRVGGIGSVGAAMQEIRESDAIWRQINQRQEVPLLLEKQVRGAQPAEKA